VAVLIVLISTVLLLFVGMAVDYGVWFRYRRAMQNACDAGALAGALNLRDDPASAAPTAERYAATNMTQDNITWDSLQATPLDENNQPTLIAPDRVRVEIQEDVFTVFFRLIARTTVHVAVDCTAKLTPIILTEGLVPLGLNYDAWGPLYDPLSEESPCADVLHVPLEQRLPPCDSFQIKMAINGMDNEWGSGNTGMLSMPEDCFDCPIGANEWKDEFISGSQQAYCYDAGQTPALGDVAMNGQPCASVMTKPGTVTGPVRTAVDARCDSGNPDDRIIMMPLLNPVYAESGGGRYTTEIWGFTAFELDCTNRPQAGSGLVTISGGFVSLVSMQAYGQETEFDTGVYTVKLVE
jgi:hypothetical protein